MVFSLIKTWKELRLRGVMGINERNCDYVLRRNPRRLFPLVDDKIKTKARAEAEGIRVPPQYGIIDSEHNTRLIRDIAEKHKDFVIKPSQGAGGDGILVISDQFENYFRTASGKMLTMDDIEFHVSGIMSGIYSLGGARDRALVEYRVKPDGIFSGISYEGVPDVRIIVYRGYPMLAMLRLPTRQSDGKANLHQGAIGVGIDLSSGVTVGGTWMNKKIAIHPDTMKSVRGVALPNWPVFMQLAARCYEISGLGYLGVDMVLDKDLGPLMLELNARPGLNIQIANDIGLAKRSQQIDREVERLVKNRETYPTPEQRVLFCQASFKQPLKSFSQH